MTLLLQQFGDGALRALLPAGANARAVFEALRAVPGVVDAVVTERHAAVSFESEAPPDGLVEAIERALTANDASSPPRDHTVRVRYGGEDLDEVAKRSGLAPADVVALHVEKTYVVALVGFLPGFGYLRGLDPRLIVPRRASPRPRIAPLSVGVAGPYTGIYPFASPGGWNLIGTAVGFSPFDVRAGAALGLGDRVRFARDTS
ncbi:MAG: carboxyltransferase domain-containing protein [Polyangiaceae bacterium]